MAEFINREQELEALNRQYISKQASFIVLYGRRRAGKTSLIQEFIKDKPYIYFLASEESELQNISQLKNLIAEYAKDDYLNNIGIDNWDTLFKLLSKNMQDQKLILVIDEFQYLGKTNTAFPSIFQRNWDTILQKLNIMVILCGSHINMMESQTLNYASPLYGRRTGQIMLKQIDFKHYHKFFNNIKYKDQIEYYAITGGIPKYIELFNARGNIFNEIERNILDKQSFLFEEPLFLLQNEVSEIGSYFSIIKSIAAGNHRLGKISSDLEVKQTGLTKYLRTLINLDILEREVPITESKPEKSKMGLYKIKDNYINFWFKFIYPDKGKLELSDKKFVMDKIKRNFVDSHVSFVYEDICIGKMFEMSASGKLNFNKCGRWWDNKTEIDIVAYDSMGDNIIFGECKYRKQPMGADVFYELLDKKKQVIWKNDTRKESYVLFSISGFTDSLKQLAAERKDILLSQ
ncbi:MAG: ATP-binding protein [Chitinispirillia bacterium]|nr:ATP-binding protein [Chitinispirillia bacterium]